MYVQVDAWKAHEPARLLCCGRELCLDSKAYLCLPRPRRKRMDDVQVDARNAQLLEQHVYRV